MKCFSFCHFLFFSCNGSTITFSIIILKIEIQIAATIATPNPDILKASPNNESVIFNVIALITIKKKPKVTRVIGSVIKIKSGYTNTFKIANIILAIIAVCIFAM